MDPNATLRELRDIVKLIIAGQRSFSAEQLAHIGELFDGLDSWLTKGGFLPGAWERDPYQHGYVTGYQQGHQLAQALNGEPTDPDQAVQIMQDVKAGRPPTAEQVAKLAASYLAALGMIAERYS